MHIFWVPCYLLTFPKKESTFSSWSSSSGFCLVASFLFNKHRRFLVCRFRFNLWANKSSIWWLFRKYRDVSKRDPFLGPFSYLINTSRSYRYCFTYLNKQTVIYNSLDFFQEEIHSWRYSRFWTESPTRGFFLYYYFAGLLLIAESQ